MTPLRAASLLVLFPALASMSLPLPAVAASLLDDARATVAQGRVRNEITIDNDSLLLNRDDGLYTSGLQFDRQYQLRQAQGTLAYGWRIGQALYTASDIKLAAAEVGPPDHPYAAWLFAGAYHGFAADDGSTARYGFDVGCIGPCAGGEVTQTNLHRLLRQPLPQGWARQVSNEAGLVVYGDVAPLRWQLRRDIDLTPNFHGRFGNIFTDAGVGLRLRAGQLDRAQGQSQLLGLARIDVKAVAYNATLQGGYFSGANAHTVAPKRVVGEIELGAQWQYGNVGLRASVVRRTNEISGLANAIGTQNFVRVLFSYSP